MRIYAKSGPPRKKTSPSLRSARTETFKILFRKSLLLEQFLDEVPDPQEDHRADEGAEDLAIPLSPEGTAGADFTEQPAADYTAEETDDDVPDETTLVLPDKETGQPTGDGAEEQSKNDVHGFVVIS